jgi:predicted ribosome quality control (RQC) complex YloA/Tae2 family protein
MNEATIGAIVEELRETLKGRVVGKIFQLSPHAFVIDFRLPSNVFLFISIEPNMPRIYLIRRSMKFFEKSYSSNFLMFLRKRISGAILEDIRKLPQERIVRLDFATEDEVEGSKRYALMVQLTGRSANLFLLDETETILMSLRENKGEGQVKGSKFLPPFNPRILSGDEKVFDRGNYDTLSEALDAYYTRLQQERNFQSKANAAASAIKKNLTKLEIKEQKLLEELKNAQQADKWKRYGDLILANLHDAVWEDGRLLLTDYFDENTPIIEIEADENIPLTELAEKFFKRYSKARRAEEEIRNQLERLKLERDKLAELQDRLNAAIDARDESFLDAFLKQETGKKNDEKQESKFSPYARRFMSSDGMEILVGKGAKENDYLTFRIAKSLDFWLHAADYAGSHVIVRNPNKLEGLPPKTLLEAAELAAFYSQAKKQPKVAVNYTQKKFVNKPKSAPPGLVSLSRFKTILVEPKIPFN